MVCSRVIYPALGCILCAMSTAFGEICYVDSPCDFQTFTTSCHPATTLNNSNRFSADAGNAGICPYTQRAVEVTGPSAQPLGYQTAYACQVINYSFHPLSSRAAAERFKRRQSDPYPFVIGPFSFNNIAGWVYPDHRTIIFQTGDQSLGTPMIQLGLVNPDRDQEALLTLSCKTVAKK